DLDQAAETAATIRAAGASAAAIGADVSRREDAQRSVAETVAHFGRLDILVNNAGIFGFKPVAEIDEATWRKFQAVNADSVFFHCQAAIARMRAAGTGGAIVNIASMS